MDSLVEVGAAALAAPSAAVAGLVAASISANTMPPPSNASTPRSRGRTSPTPACPSTLRACTPPGARPAVAAMAVAAVKFRFRLQGLASPAGPATDRVLAGLRREGKGRGRGQVDGMRFSEVKTAAAVAANDGGSVAGLRDAALLAVASDGLLRVSEVAAVDVGDVQAETDGSGRLSVNAIRRIIRSRAAAVGIEGRVSGHSLRVGGAQSLAAGGASIVEMQTAGRWQSPAMPGHYARGQLAARGAVARVRYGRG